MITQTDVANTVSAIALGADADYKKRMFYPQDEKFGSAAATHGFAEGFQAKSMKFTLEPTTTPSKALHQFFYGANKVVCECHAFVMAVYYHCVQELLGSKLFDVEFRNMDISGKFSRDSPLHKVLQQATLGDSDDAVAKGDWIYISNIPDYKEKHSLGNAAGWNLICISDGSPKRYVGFGLSEPGTEVQGKTIDEIKGILLAEYEKKPVKIAFTDPPSTSRGRSGSVGSSESKSSMKYSDMQETLESGSKMITGLKKQALSGGNKTEPYFERDSKRYRIDANKLNQLKLT